MKKLGSTGRISLPIDPKVLAIEAEAVKDFEQRLTSNASLGDHLDPARVQQFEDLVAKIDSRQQHEKLSQWVIDRRDSDVLHALLSAEKFYVCSLAKPVWLELFANPLCELKDAPAHDSSGELRECYWRIGRLLKAANKQDHLLPLQAASEEERFDFVSMATVFWTPEFEGTTIQKKLIYLIAADNSLCSSFLYQAERLNKMLLQALLRELDDKKTTEDLFFLLGQLGISILTIIEAENILKNSTVLMRIKDYRKCGYTGNFRQFLSKLRLPTISDQGIELIRCDMRMFYQTSLDFFASLRLDEDTRKRIENALATIAGLRGRINDLGQSFTKDSDQWNELEANRVRLEKSQTELETKIRQKEAEETARQRAEEEAKRIKAEDVTIALKKMLSAATASKAGPSNAVADEAVVGKVVTAEDVEATTKRSALPTETVSRQPEKTLVRVGGRSSEFFSPKHSQGSRVIPPLPEQENFVSATLVPGHNEKTMRIVFTCEGNQTRIMASCSLYILVDDGIKTGPCWIGFNTLGEFFITYSGSSDIKSCQVRSLYNAKLALTWGTDTKPRELMMRGLMVEKRLLEGQGVQQKLEGCFFDTYQFITRQGIELHYQQNGLSNPSFHLTIIHLILEQGEGEDKLRVECTGKEGIYLRAGCSVYISKPRILRQSQPDVWTPISLSAGQYALHSDGQNGWFMAKPDLRGIIRCDLSSSYPTMVFFYKHGREIYSVFLGGDVQATPSKTPVPSL